MVTLDKKQLKLTGLCLDPPFLVGDPKNDRNIIEIYLGTRTGKS